MKAIQVRAGDDGPSLELSASEAPEPGPGQVLIDVAAAGVNRADLLQARGLYPPPPGVSSVLGLECAGRISLLGSGVDHWSVGDRVMALLAGGGYAEAVVADAGCLLPVPERLDDLEAAAVPETFLTAHLNLVELGAMTSGSTVLVHGGSGGVGTAAIQLAQAVGARVVVTAGSPERCRRCLDLGADAALDHHADDWADRARRAGGGYDVVLDCVGARYLEPNLGLLAVGGRLVVIGLMGGARAEIDLGRLLARRLTVIGSTLRSRPAADKARLVADFGDRFLADLETGALAPVVEASLPLAEAADAHRRMAAGEVFGKLVLRVG